LDIDEAARNFTPRLNGYDMVVLVPAARCRDFKTMFAGSTRGYKKLGYCNAEAMDAFSVIILDESAGTWLCINPISICLGPGEKISLPTKLMY